MGRVQAPGKPLTNSVTLGKFLKVNGLSFFRCQMRIIAAPTRSSELMGRLALRKGSLFSLYYSHDFGD